MDGERAVAITEVPSHVVNGDLIKKHYEELNDVLEVLPDTATATAAIAELAEGRFDS